MTTPASTSAAPQPVVISYWLYIVGAIIGIVGLIVALVTIPAAISAAQAQVAAQGSSTAASGAVQAAVIVGVVISVILSVAFAVVIVIFARLMRAGRNWARIVLAVIAALQIFGVAGGYGIGAVHFLVLLAALILSFLPQSNAYFRSGTATAPAV